MLVGIVDRKAVVIIELGFLSVLRLLHEREHWLALWVAAQYGDTLLVWGVDIELEREESLAILVLNYEPALPAAKFLAYKGELWLMAVYLLSNLPGIGEWQVAVGLRADGCDGQSLVLVDVVDGLYRGLVDGNLAQGAVAICCVVTETCCQHACRKGGEKYGCYILPECHTP